MKIETTTNGVILSGTAERDINRRTYDFYIGIDPDLKESGVAVWYKKRKQLLQCTTHGFFSLYDYLKNFTAHFLNFKNETFIVHIEGGWLNEKSNFHSKERQAAFSLKEKRTGERIAKNVGNNHAVGLLIVEMCIHLDLSFVVRKPHTPIFKDEIKFKAITGWQQRTNADARSAASYVYSF